MTEFSSEGGNDYVRQRPIDEIAENLMKPSEVEKPESSDEEEPAADATPTLEPELKKDAKKGDVKSKRGSEPVVDEIVEEKNEEL